MDLLLLFDRFIKLQLIQVGLITYQILPENQFLVGKYLYSFFFSTYLPVSC